MRLRRKRLSKEKRRNLRIGTSGENLDDDRFL
jgi:hypothetical protein